MNEIEWWVCTVEYYLATKKNEIWTHARMWKNPEDMLRETDIKGQTKYDSICSEVLGAGPRLMPYKQCTPEPHSRTKIKSYRLKITHGRLFAICWKKTLSAAQVGLKLKLLLLTT